MARDTKGSSLRNRVRVTHKSRLKVLRGNIDAEAAIGEDDQNPHTASTAGVDAEDASEHHLQQVLHAAAQRTASISAIPRTRGAVSTPAAEAPQTFIPTPDANGLASNYETLYPPNKFTEPSTYIKFSDTVDECQDVGFANGFTYYLDDKDMEWLEKNNQIARGEGTSASTTIRSRSAKKGKDPEPPIPVSEADFELVMAIFERATDDRFPFLHVDVSNFPDLSAYEPVFSSPLPVSYFAAYSVPDSVPNQPHLCRLARLIYPHWRERKIDRQGRRIIPQLNYDESNEGDSYVCFRRRDVKPIRKTRRTDTASVDKLIRLKGEMANAMELATNVVAREEHRREAAQESSNVWKARVKFVDLKRKYPSLGTAEDDQLLYDKERVVKRLRPEAGMGTIKIMRPRTSIDSTSIQGETQKHPRERAAQIQAAIEKEMARKKDQDYQWEEVTDLPYQAFQIHVNQRHFRAFPVPDLPSSTPIPPSRFERAARPPALRLRTGRGGRIVLDRRLPRQYSRTTENDSFKYPWSPFPQVPLDVDDKIRREEEEERARSLAEMWKYDRDYMADGNTEDIDRVIVDDYEPRYMKCRISLLNEQDQHSLSVDPMCIVQANAAAESRFQGSGLARLVAAMKRENANRPAQTPTPVSVQVSTAVPIPPSLPQPSIAANQPKTMPPPSNPTPSRPNGLRVVSTSPSSSSNPPPLNGTPTPMTNAVNGTTTKTNASPPLNTPLAHPNAISIPPDSAPPIRVSSPMRPKSQPQQQQPMTNGFPPATNPFTTFPNNGVYHNHPQGQQVNGNRAQLNQTQYKSLQAAYALSQSQPAALQQQSVPIPTHYSMPVAGVNGAGAHNISNLNLAMGAQNMQLKLPASRVIPRGPGNQQISGVVTPASPIPSHALPRGVVSAAANGHHITAPRPGQMMAHAHHLAAHLSPPSPHLNSHPSPPHPSQQPLTLPSPSPSHQQQAVGGPGS